MNPGNSFKCAILGAPSVGKTTLVKRITKGSQSSSEDGIVTHTFFPLPDFSQGGVNIYLDFIDSTDSYVNDAKKLSYFTNDCECVIICYDICNMDSFERAVNFFYEHEKGKEILLLGLKSDLESSRIVPTSYGERVSQMYDIFFMEVSALNGTNIDVTSTILGIRFQKLSKRMYSSLYSPSPKRDIQSISKDTYPITSTSGLKSEASEKGVNKQLKYENISTSNTLEGTSSPVSSSSSASSSGKMKSYVFDNSSVGSESDESFMDEESPFRQLNKIIKKNKAIHEDKKGTINSLLETLQNRTVGKPTVLDTALADLSGAVGINSKSTFDDLEYFGTGPLTDNRAGIQVNGPHVPLTSGLGSSNSTVIADDASGFETLSSLPLRTNIPTASLSFDDSAAVSPVQQSEMFKKFEEFHSLLDILGVSPSHGLGTSNNGSSSQSVINEDYEYSDLNGLDALVHKSVSGSASPSAASTLESGPSASNLGSSLHNRAMSYQYPTGGGKAATLQLPHPPVAASLGRITESLHPLVSQDGPASSVHSRRSSTTVIPGPPESVNDSFSISGSHNSSYLDGNNTVSTNMPHSSNNVYQTRRNEVQGPSNGTVEDTRRTAKMPFHPASLISRLQKEVIASTPNPTNTSNSLMHCHGIVSRVSSSVDTSSESRHFSQPNSSFLKPSPIPNPAPVPGAFSASVGHTSANQSVRKLRDTHRPSESLGHYNTHPIHLNLNPGPTGYKEVDSTPSTRPPALTSAASPPVVLPAAPTLPGAAFPSREASFVDSLSRTRPNNSQSMLANVGSPKASNASIVARTSLQLPQENHVRNMTIPPGTQLPVILPPTSHAHSIVNPIANVNATANAPLVSQSIPTAVDTKTSESDSFNKITSPLIAPRSASPLSPGSLKRDYIGNLLVQFSVDSAPLSIPLNSTDDPTLLVDTFLSSLATNEKNTAGDKDSTSFTVTQLLTKYHDLSEIRTDILRALCYHLYSSRLSQKEKEEVATELSTIRKIPMLFIPASDLSRNHSFPLEKSDDVSAHGYDNIKNQSKDVFRALPPTLSSTVTDSTSVSSEAMMGSSNSVEAAQAENHPVAATSNVPDSPSAARRIVRGRGSISLGPNELIQTALVFPSAASSLGTTGTSENASKGLGASVKSQESGRSSIKIFIGESSSNTVDTSQPGTAGGGAGGFIGTSSEAMTDFKRIPMSQKQSFNMSHSDWKGDTPSPSRFFPSSPSTQRSVTKVLVRANSGFLSPTYASEARRRSPAAADAPSATEEMDTSPPPSRSTNDLYARHTPLSESHSRRQPPHSPSPSELPAEVSGFVARPLPSPTKVSTAVADDILKARDRFLRRTNSSRSAHEESGAPAPSTERGRGLSDIPDSSSVVSHSTLPSSLSNASRQRRSDPSNLEHSHNTGSKLRGPRPLPVVVGPSIPFSNNRYSRMSKGQQGASSTFKTAHNYSVRRTRTGSRGSSLNSSFISVDGDDTNGFESLVATGVNREAERLVNSSNRRRRGPDFYNGDRHISNIEIHGKTSGESILNSIYSSSSQNHSNHNTHSNAYPHAHSKVVSVDSPRTSPVLRVDEKKLEEGVRIRHEDVRQPSSPIINPQYIKSDLVLSHQEHQNLRRSPASAYLINQHMSQVQARTPVHLSSAPRGSTPETPFHSQMSPYPMKTPLDHSQYSYHPQNQSQQKDLSDSPQFLNDFVTLDRNFSGRESNYSFAEPLTNRTLSSNASASNLMRSASISRIPSPRSRSPLARDRQEPILPSTSSTPLNSNPNVYGRGNQELSRSVSSFELQTPPSIGSERHQQQADLGHLTPSQRSLFLQTLSGPQVTPPTDTSAAQAAMILPAELATIPPPKRRPSQRSMAQQPTPLPTEPSRPQVFTPPPAKYRQDYSNPGNSSMGDTVRTLESSKEPSSPSVPESNRSRTSNSVSLLSPVNDGISRVTGYQGRLYGTPLFNLDVELGRGKGKGRIVVCADAEPEEMAMEFIRVHGLSEALMPKLKNLIINAIQNQSKN